MTFYSLVLFVHVTAVLALYAALAFEVLSLFHLRRASTVLEVQLWIDPVPRLPVATMGSLLVVVFSGIYMTIQMSAFGQAWPKVTIAALFLVAPIAAVTGRRTHAIRRACAKATAVNSELRGRLRDPVLKVSLAIRIAVILGLVLLMGAKPELSESIAIVGASVVLGLISSSLGWRRTAS